MQYARCPPPAAQTFWSRSTWGDARYIETWFGVTAAQNDASGLSERRYDAGVATAYLRLGASWRFNPRWSISGDIERTRLANAAARSPVVEQRFGTSAQLALVRAF